MDAVLCDWTTADVPPRLHAALRLLEHMTVHPADIDRAFAQGLRDDGLDDEAIAEAANVGFHYNLINRVADAFDFQLPDDKGTGRLAAVLDTMGLHVKGGRMDPPFAPGGDGVLRPAGVALGWDHLLTVDVGSMAAALVGLEPVAIWTWNGTDRPTKWDAATFEKQGRLETGSAFDLVYGGTMHRGGGHLLLDTMVAPIAGGMPSSVGGASEWEAVDLAPDHGGVWLSTGDALQSWRFLPEGMMRPVGPRQVWDGSSSKGDRIERVSWTPDGTALVAAASDGSITRWDVASGENTWEHVHDCDDSGAPRQDRECRIDGADIERMRPLSSVDVEELVVNGDRMVGRLRDGRLQQLDARGRSVGAPLPSATGDELASLNISPDGNLITEGSGEKNVVRDARTGETRHETRSIGMVFSPDSTWLAAAGATTELLHLPSGQRVDLQPPRPGYAVRTAFSPDGRHLALVETDMEAGDQLWVVDVSAAAAAAGLSLD